jgi:hypothetical protein
MKINILTCILLSGLASFFLLLSSQSFAISQEIKTKVKECYDNPPSCKQAKEYMKKMVANKEKTEGDRLYALIYLAIFSLQEKNVIQAKNFFCQILTLKPDFDPDLSVCDITEDFKGRFSALKKKQNGCKVVEPSCEGVKLTALKNQLKICETLFLKRYIKYSDKKTVWNCYQKAKTLCQNHREVNEGFEKIKKCDAADRRLKDCKMGEICYQEARKLCKSHPKFQCNFEITEKCNSVEKQLKECKDNKFSTISDKKETASSCYQEAQNLCQNHSEFLKEYNQSHPEFVKEFERFIKCAKVEERLLKRCKSLFYAKKITTNGGKKTALSCYKEARDLCPNHPDVQQGFEDMENKYKSWANQYLKKKNDGSAQNALKGLKKVNPQSPYIPELEQRLQQLR